ncbi:hypothetical protein TI39_contig595g00011 [Zymoseptoria brevis]|uniref:MJ1316 RNA cyclic group end recognition domain-containing protein n=1 Tax=Zymoseptoria brevis TaxID=1047168 RepID=A0A0F4GHE9_9PEZI|nr:hypothetical protein TI39_contig595g00011 [Zymoseptoria brevis]
MSQHANFFVHRTYNHDAEEMAWRVKDAQYGSDTSFRYWELDKIIRKISALLNFDYVQPENGFHPLDMSDINRNNASSRPKAQFPTYIFPTLPFAAGGCPPHEVIELVCVADMSARTFFESAKERLCTAGLAILEDDYSGHLAGMASEERDENVVRVEISTSSPLGGAIKCVMVLRYQHKPADFDGQITARRQITRATARKSPALARVLDQQLLNRQSFDLSHELFPSVSRALVNPAISTVPEAGASPSAVIASQKAPMVAPQTGVSTPAGSLFLHREYLRLQYLARDMGLMSPRLGLLSTEILLLAWTKAMQHEVEQNDNTGAELSFERCLRSLIEVFQTPDLTTPRGKRFLPSTSADDEDIYVNTEGIDATLRFLTDLCNNLPSSPCVSSPASGLRYFASAYPAYIRIDLNCSAMRQNLRPADAFFDVLYNTQKSIRIETLGEIRARPWPYQLTSRVEHGQGMSIYLIGLYSSKNDKPPVLPSSIRNALLNSHVNVLFDDVFQDTGFDHTNCFVHSETLTPEGLREFLDTTDVISRHVAQGVGYSEEFLPEDDFTSPGAQMEFVTEPKAGPVATTESDLAGTTAVPDASSNDRVGCSKRFRDADSAAHRLCWDAAHRDIDYEVGYQDRFLPDLVWKPLHRWQRATEEEDFVPSHRIRQIRRQWDGVVVWDREARFDMT